MIDFRNFCLGWLLGCAGLLGVYALSSALGIVNVVFGALFVVTLAACVVYAVAEFCRE